jgi:diadenosine tetraphosphate (Ap4A) HIT family hydrolase
VIFNDDKTIGYTYRTASSLESWSAMTTLIHQRVEEARCGVNPKVICHLPSGWVVMGDKQFLPGYSLLLADPVVPSINDLEIAARVQFLQDMVLVGDALLEVTGALRINYEILGNSEAALHVHILPRYESEPEALRRRPAWFYDWNAAVGFDQQRDADLMQRIAEAIARHLKP